MRRLDAILVVVLAAALTPGAGVGSEKRKQEEKRLQGTWSMVTLETEGQQVSQELVDRFNVRLTFLESGQYSYQVGSDSQDAGTYRINVEVFPKELDLTATNDEGNLETYKAIFKFEADRLVACIPDSAAQARPIDFMTSPGSKTRTAVFKLSGQSPERRSR